MRETSDWPIAFFDDDYLRIYAPMLTEELTQREVGFIESSLEVPKGGEVLDLACGVGRHAIAMEARGYRVTGVDFNAHYLALARAAAARSGAAVDWQQGDMRALAFERRFYLAVAVPAPCSAHVVRPPQAGEEMSLMLLV